MEQVFELARYSMVYVRKDWLDINPVEWYCERKISKSSL
jgi:hypothetical protein